MSSSYFMLRVLRRKRKKLQANRNKEAPNVQPCDSLNQNYSTSEIETESMQCRICLKEGNIPIYATENTYNIAEAIKFLSGIEIFENDALPKQLCTSCLSLLEGALMFRKSAQDSDKILRLSPTKDVARQPKIESEYHDNISITSDIISQEYHCELCQLKFNSDHEYITHKNSRQHKNVRIQCPICFGLLTAQLYKKHLLRHQSTSHLICEVCGKLYRKDNLIRHLQLHSYELPFQCQRCPYRGRFLESLKIHMRTHTGSKPFSCDKCELRFITRSNLNRHLLTHKKEKPHKCIECGREFYTKREMDLHFKSDHVGIKDFGCKLCGNKYGTRKALMRHELRVHKREKMAKGRMPLFMQEEYKMNAC